MSIQNEVAADGAIQGFGSHSSAEVEQLQKALSISQNYGTTAPNALTGGSALAVEDLDRTLKLVTNGLEHLKLWKDILKNKVSQTVQEYNVQNSYGTEVSPFFAMGSNPSQTDANYEREVVQVKYLGTHGSVQHDLTLIQAAHGPVIAREVKNKTVELLSRNERAMFEADSSINSLEYDGIDAQIRTKESQATYKSTAFSGFESAGGDDSVIIDVDGQFTDEIAEDMALRAINNFGQPMDCYLPTDVHSRFSKDYFNKQRTLSGETVSSGNRVNEHVGSLNYRFKPSLFNRPRKVPLTVATSAGTVATFGAFTTPVNADSQFLGTESHSYIVSIVYPDGETVGTAASGAQTPSAGDDVSNVITGYDANALYANVFRSPDGTVVGHEYIGRVALGTAGVTVIPLDLNATVEGSSKAYLLMHDEDTLCFKQLGSMVKYDLAVTTTAYSWLQLLYGTPLVAAARKHIIAENITS